VNFEQYSYPCPSQKDAEFPPEVVIWCCTLVYCVVWIKISLTAIIPSLGSNLLHCNHVMHARTHAHTTILWPSWILSKLPGRAGTKKVKTNLDLLEQEIVTSSGINWVIRKSAPWPKHITMPASHRWIFYRLDALPATPNQQHESTEGFHGWNSEKW